MVPLRKVFETMSIEITWDASTSTIKASKGNISAELSIDNQTAKVNGQSQHLDAAPVIINGRTLVPVRFVAEAFDAKVDWDQKTKTVLISTTTDTSNAP